MRYREYTALPGLKWMTYRAGAHRVRCVGAGYKEAVALQVYITEVLLGPQGYEVW